LDATAARAVPPTRSPALPHPLTPEIERHAAHAAAEAGLELRGVEVLTHRIPMAVRVLVQRTDGSDVSLDECAALSAPLGEALEATGLIEGAYVLEVSSPGIGEDLHSDRDFNSFRGFPVEVLRREASGQSSQAGLLLGRDDQAVLLNLRGRTVRIPREEVVQVRLTNPDGDP
jgi:ribosome maturation factor RimP